MENESVKVFPGTFQQRSASFADTAAQNDDLRVYGAGNDSEELTHVAVDPIQNDFCQRVFRCGGIEDVLAGKIRYIPQAGGFLRCAEEILCDTAM